MRIKIVAEWRTRSPGSRFELAGRRATTPGETGVPHVDARFDPQAAHAHPSGGLYFYRGLCPRHPCPRLVHWLALLDWRDRDRLVRLFLPRPGPPHPAR